MALYEITAESFNKIPETSFDVAGVRERLDLQRLLRKQIDVISPDTLVVAEEFGEWEESKRRIDLLGIDKDGNLVVIELKRTDDGGHMELQGLRYAAMVSTMTFDRVVETYGNYLARHGRSEDPKAAILDFLEWEEPDEDQFAQDVRIILASANFSKELTTAVMWLNERDLDIRCIRVIPYQDNGRVLIDVQQLIPLPEVTEYQVQIREKEHKGRKDRAERYTLRRKFWAGLLAIAETKTKLHSNISPSDYHWIGAGAGLRGVSYNYKVRQQAGTVELYIDRGEVTINKRIFDELFKQKNEIERVFGGSLLWERLDSKRASTIGVDFTDGGYRDDESKWPLIQEAMIDGMIRLERAIGPHLINLRNIIETLPSR
jgi:hypothetical protein